MHRAGEDGVRRRFNLRLPVREIASWILLEAGKAARATEVVGFPLVVGAMRRRVRIHRHPAYRILYRPCIGGILVMKMVVMAAAAVGRGIGHGILLARCLFLWGFP